MPDWLWYVGILIFLLASLFVYISLIESTCFACWRRHALEATGRKKNLDGFERYNRELKCKYCGRLVWKKDATGV